MGKMKYRKQIGVNLPLWMVDALQYRSSQTGAPISRIVEMILTKEFEMTKVYDWETGMDIDAEVLETKKINDEAAYFKVRYGDTGDIFAVIQYDDGAQFTQRDWQGKAVEFCEISGEKWVYRGKEAIMLDGLPKILE